MMFHRKLFPFPFFLGVLKVSALNEAVSGSVKSVFKAWDQRLNTSEVLFSLTSFVQNCTLVFCLECCDNASKLCCLCLYLHLKYFAALKHLFCMEFIL